MQGAVCACLVSPHPVSILGNHFCACISSCRAGSSWRCCLPASNASILPPPPLCIRKRYASTRNQGILVRFAQGRVGGVSNERSVGGHIFQAFFFRVRAPNIRGYRVFWSPMLGFTWFVIVSALLSSLFLQGPGVLRPLEHCGVPSIRGVGERGGRPEARLEATLPKPWSPPSFRPSAQPHGWKRPKIDVPLFRNEFE